MNLITFFLPFFFLVRCFGSFFYLTGFADNFFTLKKNKKKRKVSSRHSKKKIKKIKKTMQTVITL